MSPPTSAVGADVKRRWGYGVGDRQQLQQKRIHSPSQQLKNLIPVLWAKEITDGTIKNVSDLALKIVTVIPGDPAFEQTVAVARVSDTKLARYYLRCLQRVPDGGDRAEYGALTDSSISLEHILPLKANPADWGHIKEEDREANVTRLGNLALLITDDYSKVGNQGYGAKEATLNDSGFTLTSMAAGKQQWTISEIDERQKALAKLAPKAWPLKVK